MSLACGRDNSVMQLLAGLEERKSLLDKESRAASRSDPTARRRMSTLPTAVRENSTPAPVQETALVTKRRLSDFMDGMKERNSFRNVESNTSSSGAFTGRRSLQANKVSRIPPLVNKVDFSNRKQNESAPATTPQQDFHKALKERMSPVKSQALTPMQQLLSRNAKAKTDARVGGGGSALASRSRHAVLPKPTSMGIGSSGIRETV
jgi:hypothetical protein